MHWDLSSGQATDGACMMHGRYLPADCDLLFPAHLSVGAAADSAHEYTLKQYLMTARQDTANLEMCKVSPSTLPFLLNNMVDLRFTSHVLNNLMFISPNRHLLYVTDSNTYRGDNRYTHHFEHLSCFLPGLLALGVHTLPLNHLEDIGLNYTALADDLLLDARMGYKELASFNLADLHLWAAEGLAQTCYLTYADQPTGLGPDIITVRSGGLHPEIPWMVAMQEWKRQGRRGLPPGVGDKRPWTGDSNNTTDMLSRETSITGKDYYIRNSEYQLRPEVSKAFSL